jgi:hypothetical protein
MSKKLIISESQLQKLMERKHSYRDNSPEGDMEESMGAESAIVNSEDDDVNEMIFPAEDHEGDELKTMEEVIGGLKQSHDDLIDLDYLMERLFDGMRKNNENSELGDMDSKIGEAYQKVNQALQIVDQVLTSLESNDNGEKTQDDSNDISINESLMSIRNNFRRFL